MRRKTVVMACVLCALMMIVSSTVVLNMPATKALPSPGDVNRSSEIVFWDDFEGDLGKWTGIIEENGGVFMTTNVQSKTGYWSEESTKSLYANAWASSMAAFGRVDYSSPIQEDYAVILDFRLETTSNHWFKVFADLNVYMVIKHDTKLIQYLGENVEAGRGYSPSISGNNTYQHITDLQPYTWYRIELRVYLSRLQYDIYINGDFVMMSDFFNNQVHYPEYFVVGDQYTSCNYGIGHWDNVHVGPLHTIPFEEDFEGSFDLGQWTTVVTSGETLEVVNGDIHVDSEDSGTSYVHTPFLDFGKHRHYVVRFEFRYIGAHHFFKVYVDPNIIVILNSYKLYSYRGGSTLEYIGDLGQVDEHAIEFRVSAQPPNSPVFSTILDGEYLGENNGRFDPYHFGYVSFGDTKDTSIHGKGYWKSMSVQPDKRDSTWAMSLHRRWNRDSIEDGYTALEYVRILNVSYARLNFVWKEIEPSDDDWDLDRIKWYHNLLDQLEGMGLDVILIADQWDDAPGWARTLWGNGQTNAFVVAFGDFVRKLAEEYGHKAYYYQILNECNHRRPGSPPWDLLPPMSYSHCVWLFEEGYTALFNEEGGHQGKFKTIVNVFAHAGLWESWISNFMAAILPFAVDIIAVDNYPGIWNTHPTRDPEDIDWSPLDTIESLMTTYGKDGAIMETGYDTTDDGGDEDQKDWIYYNLPVIQDRMRKWDYTHAQKYVLQAYYELRDDTTGGGCPFPYWECLEWGLMRDDWTKKVGYPEFGGRALDFHRWSSVIKADRDAPGHQTEGGGIAFAEIGHDPEKIDALFMIVDTGGSPGAENKYKYVIFWDIQPDGSFLDWDAFSPNKKVYGTQSEGGGAAIAQIDNDPAGRQDVVFMNVDIGSSENQISYRIGWNIKPDGSIDDTKWSGKVSLGDAGGHETDGGGIALGDLDNNGNLDVLVMVADVAGDYRYSVAWDIQPTGTPLRIDGPFVGGWSIGCDKCLREPGRRYSEGAGVELMDIDGNGVLDAVFTALVNPEGDSCQANRFMYRIAWNARSDGTFDRWSVASGLGASAGGHDTAGGGLGLADVNTNGKPDLIFMSIPYTGGGSDNEFKYRVKWDVDIWTIPYD